MAVLSVYVLVYAILGLGQELNLDARTLRYTALLVLQGQIPYEEVREFNFPSTYLYNMFTIKLLGMNNIAFTLVDYAVVTIGCLAIVGIMRQLASDLAIPAGLTYGAWHIALSHGTAMERDVFIATFSLICVLAFSQFVNTKSEWWLVLAGLSLGVAGSIKPTSGLLCLLLVLLLERRQQRFAALRLACYTAFPILASFGWIYSAGGLPAFWEILTRETPVHNSTKNMTLRYLNNSLFKDTLIVITLVMAGVIIWNQSRWRIGVTTLLLTCLFGLFHYLFQGKGYDYHTYPLVAPGIALSFLCFGRRSTYLAIFQTVIVGFLIILAIPEQTSRFTPPKEAVATLQTELEDLSRTGDHIMIVEHFAILHEVFLNSRLNSVRGYWYDYLVTSPTHTEFVERRRMEFMSDVRRFDPEIVVLGRRSYLEIDFERFNNFPKLIDWIGHNCMPASMEYWYQIYDCRVSPHLLARP
ncbi:MAG: glycosyltransferase family 39 protein [Patescibacteria group bacterium]